MSDSIKIFDRVFKMDFNQLKLYLDDTNFMNFQFQYRGEGNENLVFRIMDINYVLRLRKSASTTNLEKESENLRISFLYHYFIVRIFFANVFSLVPVFVEITENRLNWLNEFFIKDRPDQRKEKQLFFNVAEVYPDLAFLPVYQKFRKLKDSSLSSSATRKNDFTKQTLSDDYLKHRDFVSSLLTNATFRQSLLAKLDISNYDTMCIEIKPKQGWTAEADRLLGICPFCLSQYQKLCVRKVGSKSGYCPLDLFSGDSERMLRALQELIKCPQNNFRIFRNGILVVGEHCQNDVGSVLKEWFNDADQERSISNFCYLIAKVLIHEIENDNEPIIFSCGAVEQRDRSSSLNANAELIEQILTMLETRCRQEVSSLPDNSILGRILRMQKMDSSGLDAARNYYFQHLSEYDSDYGYVNDLIERIQSQKERKNIDVNILEAYLLSTAAKDLSILMSFERMREGESFSAINVQDRMERQYEVNISVVDVGPKPVSCLKKHLKRNEDALNSFISYHCTSLARENRP